MEYLTLADLVKRWDTDELPEYLKFKADPEKGEEKMYESIYCQNAEHFFEGKAGIRDAMRDYYTNTPENERSWEDFKKKEADFIEKSGAVESDYNREVNLIKNKAYSIHAPINKNEDSSLKDTRPNFNPETDRNPFLNALYKAMNNDGGASSVEQSVNDKYNDLFETARNIANESSVNSHAIIAGDAGVGKTYTVEDAINVGLSEWQPFENSKHKNKPTLVSVSGSIGKSFSDVLEFFYKNRHEKIILLDDADGFLDGTNEDIFNFMKVLLNSTLKGVTTPEGIRDRVNAKIQQKAQKASESTIISIDKSKLQENILSISVNDELFEAKVSTEEANALKEKIAETTDCKQIRTQEDYIGSYVNKLGLLKEADISEMAFYDDIEKAAQDEGENNDISVDLVPDRWIFDSNVIIITNLLLKNINEAVTSRCDKVQLSLTREEYFCRANQILKDLEVGQYSSTPKAAIEWAKFESFAVFKSVVLDSINFKDFTVVIGIRFDFRLIGTITNRMVRHMNIYARKNNESITDIVSNPEKLSIMENEIIQPFTRDLLRLLKGLD